KGFFQVPTAINEPIKSYAPGTPERDAVLKQYKEYYNSKVDIPLYIGSEEIKTGNTRSLTPPHDHKHVVGQYHLAEKKHVSEAIKNSLAARNAWANLTWEQRAAIFLKAADLIAGPYRSKINAATMIAQSKNIHQAEIDAACELIDFLRINVEYMAQIYESQPESSEGVWNRVEYRTLEGFVYAITPFNFTAIAGNLPASAALMGNVVIWKPSDSQVFSAKIIVDVFKEAGVPDGVINVIYGDPVMISETVLSSPDFAGLHFTGSTHVFKELWKQIGNNIHTYKTYPRIVGETGGKDFIVAHKTSNPMQVATAMARGAFEYQGQKCSAASRAYLPRSLWSRMRDDFVALAESLTVGDLASDLSLFMGAVIDDRAFAKHKAAIDRARAQDGIDVLTGSYDDSTGYFVRPTVLECADPDDEVFVKEYFGPILPVYVYDDADYDRV